MQKHKIPKSKCDKTLAKLASGENAPVVLKEFGTWSLSKPESDSWSSLYHCLVVMWQLSLLSLLSPSMRATNRVLFSSDQRVHAPILPRQASPRSIISLRRASRP